jgi:cell division transport system permease protein
VTSLFLVQGAMGFLVQALESRVDVSAYFISDTEEQNILDVQKQLLQLPEIRDVKYVSKEDALKKFTDAHQNDPTVLAALQAVGQNPLLPSLNIRTWKQGDYAKVVNFLSDGEAAGIIQKVDYQDRRPVIEKINAVTTGIQTLGFIIILIFGIAVVLVSFNTTRLAIYHARKEIEVMRLVGASNSFIRGPFFMQGVLVGVIATVITNLLFILPVFLLSGFVEQLLPGFSLVRYFFFHLPILILLQLAAGIGLGILSSAIAMKRYLEV